MAPRRAWIDPSSDESRQAQQSKQQQAQAAQQREQATQDRIFATQVMMSDQANKTDLVKHFTDLSHKYWHDVLESEVEEFRIGAQGSDLVKPSQAAVDSQQAEGNLRAVE